MALTYEAAALTRSGRERVHAYASETTLGPGDVIRMTGRDWLVERVEADTDPPRLVVKPARYRLRLRHPDGHEELGAFRRWRSDAPGVGHSFSTMEDGQAVAWTVTDAHLAREPLVETRRRKPLPGLAPPWEHVPPIWELRVGEYRVFDDVDEHRRAVNVRAIRHKTAHKATKDIL